MRRGVKWALLGLAAFGAYKLAGNGRQRSGDSRRKPTSQDLEPEARKVQGRWDEVDEASYESFPASDPPSYSPGKP